MIRQVGAASLGPSRFFLRWMQARHPGWVAALLEPATCPERTADGDHTAFLDGLYRQLLGRPIDPRGLATYQGLLANGWSRVDVALALATSEEYRSLCRQTPAATSNKGPRSRRPDRYQYRPADALWTFEAQGPADFDWLERAILDDGYYEEAGAWTLEVDLDKRVMAEIIGLLSHGRVLEVGCASGAVLEGLHQQGLSFEGIDISQMAIQRASERVRSHIHHGDLLTTELTADFDTVFGLDIFEHLNPNRLDAYFQRVATLLVPGGLLFANIPAFGMDEIFGEPFPYYLPGWAADAQAGRCFQTLHVDDAGYPVNGHLIWADTSWWVQRFEAAGFVRRTAVEAALHRRYGEYLCTESPARRSLYVFSIGAFPQQAMVIQRIEAAVSGALAGWSAGRRAAGP
jgi:SAM-dependent methyltransferase